MNALRVTFATAVIVSHAWPIGGYGPDPVLGDLKLGTFAVFGFFAISGYLIAASRASHSVGGYVLARVSRIYPGYLLSLLFVSYIAAPLASARRGGWTGHAAWSWVSGNIFFQGHASTVGSTLRGAPFGYWNGSLWTLKYEILCYLILAAVVARRAAEHLREIVLVVAFVIASAGGLAVRAHVVDEATTFGRLANLAPFFFAGAALWSCRRWIPMSRVLAAISAALIPALAVVHLSQALCALPLAYLVMWLGCSLPEPVKRINTPNDISYGMYVLAFPVAQLLVLLHVNRAPVEIFVIMCIVATIPFAFVSWFVVERPALAWAHRRRGSREIRPSALAAVTTR